MGEVETKVWMRGSLGVPDGCAGAGDVGLDRPREACDRGTLGAPGDLRHGFEVAVGCDWKTGLDDVDAHFVEHGRDGELVLEAHRGAGALLAVAQGGVENDDGVGGGR